jgi:hypothetical protein
MEGADAPEGSEMTLNETYRVWLTTGSLAGRNSPANVKVVMMDGTVRRSLGWPDGWKNVYSIEVVGHPLSLTYYPDLGE